MVLSHSPSLSQNDRVATEASRHCRGRDPVTALIDREAGIRWRREKIVAAEQLAKAARDVDQWPHERAQDQWVRPLDVQDWRPRSRVSRRCSQEHRSPVARRGGRRSARSAGGTTSAGDGQRAGSHLDAGGVRGRRHDDVGGHGSAGRPGGNGTYETVFGEVSLPRSTYQMSGRGRGLIPLDVRLGMVEGRYTPLVARIGNRSLASMPTAEEEALLTEIGVCVVSRATLHPPPPCSRARRAARWTGIETPA